MFEVDKLTDSNLAADCEAAAFASAAATEFAVSSLSLFRSDSISVACFVITSRREATSTLSSPLCAGERCHISLKFRNSEYMLHVPVDDAAESGSATIPRWIVSKCAR